MVKKIVFKITLLFGFALMSGYSVISPKNFSSEKVRTDENTITKSVAAANDSWKPVDMQNVVIEPGSALDFSSLVEEGPAGKHGRVIINSNGQMAFADNPDKAVRFFAFNIFLSHFFGQDESIPDSSDEVQFKNIEQFAEAVRLQGYSMVRLHALDIYLMEGSENNFEFNQGNLDKFYYLVSCLKNKGIYINLDMMTYSGYQAGAWNEAGKQRFKERFLIDNELREIWKIGVTQLMTDKNPYTGLTLAEDPAVALVTMFNEQDLSITEDAFSGIEELGATNSWREFLKKRYNNNFSALVQSWGYDAPKETSFETLPLFNKEVMFQNSIYGNDARYFIYEQLRDLMVWYKATLASTGYAGLSSQYDVNANFWFHAARNECPVISMHSYHAHPSSYSNSGSTQSQAGIVNTSAKYWRERAMAHYLNRPMCISEYNAPYWNKYRHEDGLIFPSYSALQDYSVITVHMGAVILRCPNRIRDFFAGIDPIQRASQVLASLIYARHYVQPSPHTIALAFNDSYLSKSMTSTRAVDNNQSKIAFLCRFGLQYDAPSPEGVPSYFKADKTIAPAVNPEIVTSQWTSSTIETTGSNMDGFISECKKSGILTPNNVSNASGGIFHSDTEELLMNVPEQSFKLITPRCEGAILKDNKETELGSVWSVETNIAAAIAVASLDTNMIDRSKRLLIVYSTDALNTGFVTSPDRTIMYDMGSVPILMQTGELKIVLKTSTNEPMDLWALSINGARTEKIPFTIKDGLIYIDINTAMLKNGPTPYFELVASSSYTTSEMIKSQKPTPVFRLYPNPAENVLNIIYFGNPLNEMEIQISEISGKIILLKTFENLNIGQQISMNIDKLRNGIYFCKMVSNNQIIGIEKFVKS